MGITRKVARILTIILTAAVLGLNALIIFTIFTAMMDSDFGKIDGIADNMFLVFGVFFALVVVIAIINVISARSGARENPAGVAPAQKKCASCGKLMDATEHSCPRCFTIQPMAPGDGHGAHIRKK